MADPIRVLQFSDTHFVESDAVPEGGGANDTQAAWDAAADHYVSHGAGADMMFVTGDVADHGRAAQYVAAADAFGQLGLPVNVEAGNHDNPVLMEANVGRAGISTSRVIRSGDWMFIFVDSCAGLSTFDVTGRQIHAVGHDRLISNGSLGAAEAAWVTEMCDLADGAHVFVWVHHPPGVPVPLSFDEVYTSEWRELLGRLPMIKGIGTGHSHIPDDYEFEGRPVFVAPSLKHNFSLDPQMRLPPGYRTYEFASDGEVSSWVHFVEDERWPRQPFGRALRALFDGEITYDELAAIVARKGMEADR